MGQNHCRNDPGRAGFLITHWSVGEVLDHQVVENWREVTDVKAAGHLGPRGAAEELYATILLMVPSEPTHERRSWRGVAPRDGMTGHRMGAGAKR